MSSVPDGSGKGLVQLWGALLERFARVTVRRPWLFVAFALVSAMPALLLASKLTLKSSFIDLLSQDDPEVMDLNRVLEKTGGLGFSTIAVPASDRPRAEAYAVALQRELEALPGVKFAQARLDVEYLEDRQLYYLSVDELRELTSGVKASIDHRVQKEAGMLLEDDEAPPPDPLAKIKQEAEAKALGLEPFIVGSDQQYLYVLVGLEGAVGEMDETVRNQGEVERVANDLQARTAPGLGIRFTGPVVNRRDDARFLQRDLTRAGLIGFGGVVLMVLLGTRRARSMLLLSAPLALGLTWTFAFAYVAVSHLNAVSGFLVSILSGLGIEYGIHLYKRYTEERRDGASAEEATVLMLRSTGGALLAACLVNAAVFAVVAVAGFRGFMEFGLIASVGMLLTMAATFALFPALNYLFDRRWPVIGKSEVAPRPLRVPKLARNLVLAVVAVMCALSGHALATGKVRFHTDWRELGSDTPTSRFDAYVVSTLGESVTQVLLYMDEPTEIGVVRESVEAVRAQRKADGKPFNVVKVVGIDDVMPDDQEAKAVEIALLGHQLSRVKPAMIAEGERAIMDRARRMTQARPFSVADVPLTLRQRFITADGKGTMALITTDALLEDSDKLIDWSRQMGELRAEVKRRNVQGALASENAIAGRIFRIIIESGPRILAATFAVVFLVLLVEFRKLTHALAVLSSVAVGMLLVTGGMALFGIELNFMNAAVLPIIVGVSLDNAIHIFHRFVEDGPESIPMVMRKTGAAALLSSATNAAGFAALFVAHNGGLRSVAALSVLGIAATVLTTTVVLPLVLDWQAKLRRA